MNISQIIDYQYFESDKYPIFFSNAVKNYLKILELISSLNIVLNTENRA